MENSSRNGLGLIRQFEGCRLSAYLCPAKVPTIGWGFTTWNGKKVQLGQKITQAEADAALIKGYDAYEAQVRALVKVPVSANQLGALVSFAFNVGVGALRSSTLLKMLNAGNYAGAAQQFARWDKASGRVLAGLTKRRAAEAALFVKS
ncbi:glycoside hydrolase family protein [Sphingobium yanoikuyae]|uniref:Lysozyme n=1 Tax=Sphingobium yanoikuyae TaxID=13690 RepID=A0A6P1GEH0_SPHYA|nr:lysozyme [Sphingobium yanoikuyae]QHD66809.1 glycoside hydrolase family protein [Sphingobium yanoikuyae]